MLLMAIWPIAHTIALRNVLLYVGGILALLYITRHRHNLYTWRALPVFFIAAFLVWVCIHYIFFTHNPALEFAQLKSTWSRVLMASLLGIGAGLFSRNLITAQKILWLGFFIFLLTFYANYAWVSITRNDWSIPYPFGLGIFGNKTGVMFYGIILLALNAGILAYLSQQLSKTSKYQLIGSISSIGLAFFSFIMVGTKNGVAIGLIIIASVIILYLIKSKKSFRNLSILTGFVTVLIFAAYLHLKLNPEWHNFFQAVATGIQIDLYPHWQDLRTHGLPMLADGTVLPESAYLRTAFIAEGLRLLSITPLGYGLVDESFGYLIKENLPNGSQLLLVGTHSGWLDFSLGYGFPGLLLVWSAIASSVFISYKESTLWSCTARWILYGAFLTWTFAEISSSHFVETLFFLITLLAAGNIPISAKTVDTTASAETAHT